MEVSECTCLRLRKTARRLTQIYDEALAPAGLTVTQFGLLANLAGHGDLSIGELAEHMGMDPTSLNRTLKPLQREKLIAGKIDSDDKRIRLISLTEPGQSVLAAAIELWKSAHQQLTAKLGVTAVSNQPTFGPGIQSSCLKSEGQIASKADLRFAVDKPFRTDILAQPAAGLPNQFRSACDNALTNEAY
jgi:DNA-binding MarR family transcriptional regulator